MKSLSNACESFFCRYSAHHRLPAANLCQSSKLHQLCAKLFCTFTLLVKSFGSIHRAMNETRCLRSLRALRKMEIWYLSTIITFLMLHLEVTAVGTTHSRRKNGNPQSRSVRVLNKSGVRIDVFWIHPNTNELAPSHTSGEGVMYGGESGISSYIGHNFEVQELPNPKSQKCQGKLCRKAYFSVNTNEDQWVTIDKDFSVILEDSKSRASQKAKDTLRECLDISNIDEMTACLTKQVEFAFDKEKEDIDFQANIRKSMAAQLSNYSCGSAITDQTSVSPILSQPIKVTTTPSVRNDTYNDEMVRTLFESDYSSIRLFENFLTTSDCNDIYGNGEVTTRIQSKIKNLLDKTGFEAMKKSLFSTNDKFHVKVESGPSGPDLDTEQSGECEMEANGSCQPEKDDRKNIKFVAPETTTTDDSVAARIILTCTKTTSANVNAATAATESIAASSFSPSGMLFFVKAGVRVVPTDRSALFIQYNEMAADMSILREPDPFLDQHVICPVNEANMTVATIMYNINHQT